MSDNDQNYEYLKLDNQLCFPLYAASRMITRLYQPLLAELDLTYTQYLILMVLWENDSVPVKLIGEKLLLNSNTLTPVLKRMEQMELIKRTRSKEDERIVNVKLTEKGVKLKIEARKIPFKMIESIDYPLEKVNELKFLLDKFLENLQSSTLLNIGNVIDKEYK